MTMSIEKQDGSSRPSTEDKAEDEELMTDVATGSALRLWGHIRLRN